MLRTGLKVIIVLLTLLVNAFLVWGLLFMPFMQLLLDSNQPYHDPPFSRGILVLNIIIWLILIVSSIYMVVVLFKKRRLFIYTPLFSILLIIVLLVVGRVSLPYPSSIFYETKNGHFYVNEIWWNQPDYIKVYKRWKSIRPYDAASDPAGKILLDTTVRYTLDSVSQTPEPY